MLPLIALLATFAVSDPTNSPSPDLARFHGLWDCKGQFASGKPTTATIGFSWSDKSGALAKIHDDLPPGGYHAQELWSVEPDGSLRGLIVAPNGARSITSEGWRDGALTFTHTRDATFAERFVYAFTAPDTLKIDWLTSRQGALYKLGDTLTCQRR